MILFFILSVYLPVDSWQNDLMDEIQVRGITSIRFPAIRPYDITELALDDYSFLSDRVWLSNITGKVYYDTITVMRLRPSVDYDWSGFSVFIEPVFKFGEDSLPPSRVFNVSGRALFSADYERAYAKYKGKNFGFFIGRERFSIGPSPRYNLLLSGYSAPLDWISYSLQSEKLRFSFFLARLDDWYTKPLEYVGDTITQYINARRFLTIKRLDFSPCPWLNFGLSEATVFGGENYTLKLYHFNPVVFVQAYQYNWNDDVNFFLGFDARILLPGLAFYGALLIDDFQLETDNNGEPHHWGLNIGVQMADIAGFRNSFWVLEYTAVSRYTYCHFVPYQRYQYVGTSIGSPYGSDYDEVFTKLTYHISKTIDIFAQASYLRKGEGDISTLWPIPEYPRVPGRFFPQDNFLSGAVQKSIDSGIGVRYFLNDKLAVELFTGYLHIDDYNNILGAQENSLVLRLHFDVLNL